MTKTIAAIATPSGRGGVGIVRVSGPNAKQILTALAPDWSDAPSHKLTLVSIHQIDGSFLDRGLVVFFEGPHSYTGEDVVEFQCHGGPYIMRSILDAALASGATIAEPGEFTQRAYINGRIDLTQAEAIADLILASSEAAHKIAADHLRGDLGEEITLCRERVAECMVLVEAAIDFSHEEHVYQIERDEILRRLNDAIPKLERLITNFDSGRRRREGIRVALLGPTNAGKSTLFNAILGIERAIVTDVAGTTRDFLEEELHLGGVVVRLVDTAGLRDASDRVEAIGIDRSRDIATDADLVLWLVDATDPDLSNFDSADPDKTWVLFNKCDVATPAPIPFDGPTFSIAAQTKAGLPALLTALTEHASHLTTGEGAMLSRTRHFVGAKRALEALQRSRIAVEEVLELEFIALDLREGLDALGGIVGAITTDDILNRIFSDFCVGK